MHHYQVFSIIDITNIFKRVKSLLTPSEEWGPVLKKNRALYESRKYKTERATQVPLMEVNSADCKGMSNGDTL